MMTPRILQELLLDTPLQSTACEEIEVAALLAYITAELEGRNAAGLYPQVHLALENSPVCQQEYQEVYDLRRREQQDEWREPPQAAYFDFSYLSAAAPWEDPPFWSFDSSGRLFIFFPAQRLQARPSLARKAERALLRAEEGPALLFSEQITPDPNLAVKLIVRTIPDQPEHCDLVINTNIPSRGGWPNLADTVVTLLYQQQPWESQATDEFGDALFTELFLEKLLDLTIVVEPTVP